MRDIKFRAYDTHTKTMLPIVDIIKFTKSENIYITRKGAYGVGINIQYQPHIELMQWTGLKDKNGKEIYEWDICLYIGSDGKGDISYPYGGEQRSFVGEKIVIDKYQSMIIGRHISTYKESINFSAPNGIINGWEIIKPYDLWNHQGWIEVIGNIYENSNLLEEEN